MGLSVPFIILLGLYTVPPIFFQQLLVEPPFPPLIQTKFHPGTSPENVMPNPVEAANLYLIRTSVLVSGLNLPSTSNSLELRLCWSR